MKCSKGCEVWVEKSDGDEKDDEWVKLHNMSHCPWCGSPLTEEPKMITRTVTYPEPMKERPAIGETYYYSALDRASKYCSIVWVGTLYDEMLFERGLIYPTADLVIQRAKAMIGEV